MIDTSAVMAILHTILGITNFCSALLRTVVPSVAAAYVIQAVAAAPSIFFQTERFYDASGSLTYLAVGALSLYLPALRAGATLPSLIAPFKAAGVGAGVAARGWRQVLLTGAVTIWAMRRELYPLGLPLVGRRLSH